MGACSLLAYDADGNVVATLDHLVARDEHGDVVGLVDFAAHEDAGGAMTDVWTVDAGEVAVKGSKVWPEWLGGRAHEFRVELDGPPGQRHIAALVHRTSGHRRERDALEAAIAATPLDAQGQRDIRHLVGGPQRPLHLDADGRTTQRPRGGNAHLPRVGA